MTDKEDFILSFYPYAYGLGWRRRFYADPDDIAQECMIECLLYADRALRSGNPTAYIKKALIRRANAVAFDSDTIHLPRDVARERREELERCVHLTPAMYNFLSETYEKKGNYDWLYEWIGKLTPCQQEGIGIAFGLESFGSSSMRGESIKSGRSWGAINNARHKGLKKLREWIGHA